MGGGWSEGNSNRPADVRSRGARGRSAMVDLGLTWVCSRRVFVADFDVAYPLSIFRIEPLSNLYWLTIPAGQ